MEQNSGLVWTALGIVFISYMWWSRDRQLPQRNPGEEGLSDEEVRERRLRRNETQQAERLTRANQVF